MRRRMLAVLIAVAAASAGGYALAQPRSGPKTSAEQYGWTGYAPLAPRAPAVDSSQPRCRASALSIDELKLHSGPYGDTNVFTITNAGRASCRIVGAPRLSLIGADGVYTPPHTVASQGTTVRLAPRRSASFWVDFLAPQGQVVAGAGQLSIAVSGVQGSIDIPLSPPASTSQQLIISTVVPGTLTKLRPSVGVARRCAAPDLSLTIRSLDEQAGSSYNVFILRNTTTVACSLGGVARLSIADRLERRLYDLPQHNGSSGSAVNLTAGGRASFWVRYTDCANFGAGRLSAVPGRQVLALPGITGTVSTPGFYPRSWPAKCPLVVSALVDGVFRAAPGFTSVLGLKSVR